MIIKKSIQSTTGNNNSVAQSFAQNIFYSVRESVTVPSIFDVPVYTTIGGTKGYYEQDPLGIFTNLVKPFIRFDFSENTESFGPDTKIVHDIYKVDWKTYSVIQNHLNAKEDFAIQSENIVIETIEEVDDITGEIKKKTITRGKSEITNEVKSIRKPGTAQGSRIDNTITKPTIADIQDMLGEPVYSITANTTGITTSIYDLQIEQDIKNLGQYKQELFEDRGQYIIDTKFLFLVEKTPGLTDYITYGYNSDGTFNEQSKSAITYSATCEQLSFTTALTIDKGEFTGLNFVGGNFFTYFQVPDKPKFEYPTPSGSIDTFTPKIYWSNGENDIDNYLVQVSYNTGDTAFTGSVFSYVVPRDESSKELAMNKTKDSTAEFSTDETIRKFQLPLKSASCLIFRVGNVKEVNNLFGVKQRVVTFSDNESICTSADPIRTFVSVEGDSPWVEEIAGLSEPPSLGNESPAGEYTLSGTVSGSSVVGATMQLVYPNSSFVSTLTDSASTFSFTGLEDGTYTLNTTYRGYAMDSRPIVISADTSVFVEIEIRWDNEYDLWIVKENDIIKY